MYDCTVFIPWTHLVVNVFSKAALFDNIKNAHVNALIISHIFVDTVPHVTRACWDRVIAVCAI